MAEKELWEFLSKEGTSFGEDKIQIEEEKINTELVFIIAQKVVNPAEKQTTRTPYRHPNYKRHFDQIL